MKRGQSVSEFLQDIVSWGERIEDYARGLSLESFRADLKTQDAVIRCLEVIGEAASRIMKAEPDFPIRHPQLALMEAYRARNRTAHGYGSVDIDTIWRSATVACPELVANVRKVLIARRSGEA
jgi:uncharacterized protein with HEPN domain